MMPTDFLREKEAAGISLNSFNALQLHFLPDRAAFRRCRQLLSHHEECAMTGTSLKFYVHEHRRHHGILLGVIAESSQNPTLSGIKEC